MIATTTNLNMRKIQTARTIDIVKNLLGQEIKSFKAGFVLSLAYTYILLVFNHFAFQIEPNAFTNLFGSAILFATLGSYFVLWSSIMMAFIKLLFGEFPAHCKEENEELEKD